MTKAILVYAKVANFYDQGHVGTFTGCQISISKSMLVPVTVAKFLTQGHILHVQVAKFLMNNAMLLHEQFAT